MMLQEPLFETWQSEDGVTLTFSPACLRISFNLASSSVTASRSELSRSNKTHSPHGITQDTFDNFLLIKQIRLWNELHP